ncbi:MAG: phage tail protein [Deltaproteobacteria bacterium]|nr:phage tail protein [Deltaproteobacteria bacterium]
MDPIIGSIFLFAGTLAPKNWAFCNGQLLSIAQNQALFSILGTTYGGDGVRTFALPDLRGRAPVHQGSGPGLNPVQLGEVSGSESTTLLITNLPSHNHTLNASTSSGESISPSNATLAAFGTSLLPPAGPYTTAHTPNAPLSPSAIAVSGQNQPINITQPTLALNYIIATQGIYPSRS